MLLVAGTRRAARGGVLSRARRPRLREQTVTFMDRAAAAIVEDDGLGFDPAAEHQGLGLLGMRERLQLVGGTLTIESSSTGGTTLRAEVPL